MLTKEQILERERRWRLAAGIAAVAGVALIIASFGDSAAAIRGGEGAAQRLADVQGAHGKLYVAGAIQMIGWSLLAIPLAFLFRAAAARNPRVRSSLIGVVLVAPVLIGLGGLIGVGSAIQASDSFAEQPASVVEDCLAKKIDATGESEADTKKTGTTGSDATGSDAKGGTTGATVTAEQRDAFRTECEDEAAQDARQSAGLASLETGIGLAGLLGFTISVVYTALWAMRTGLLTRFWGALGIALGAVFVFFTLFTLAWFIYLGLLLVGWVPGGRPPAWAAGEAIEPPQPKGGGLFGPRRPKRPADEYDGPRDKWGEPIEGRSDELEPESAPEPLELPEADGDGSTGSDTPVRRKRKKRNG